MTTPLDQLRDAIETYVRDVNDDPHLVVTDYILGTVAINLHAASEGTTYTTVAPSPLHICLGLHTILGDHLIGDDE